MPQYFVRLEHTSDQCPSANSKIRERMLKGAPEIPQLAEKLGVKFVVGPLVLAAEHASVVLVETERIETVQEFVTRAGLSQWNSVRVSTVQSMEESLKDLEKMPPPIY
jgi:hypothetical protein